MLMHTFKNYGKASNVQNKTINNQEERMMNDTLNINNNYYKSKKLKNLQKNISQSKSYLYI